MIRINSNGGSIALGKFSFSWSNADPVFQWAAYSVLCWGDWSLEFGDIDNGNGIFLTHFKDGDLEFTKTLLRL